MGAAVLADFYGKCEAGGFEEVKLTYDYDYVDHVTGEVAHMSHEEPPVESSLQHAFDGLVVCTGTNTWASLPKFKGQEEFQVCVLARRRVSTILNSFIALSITLSNRTSNHVPVP